MYVKDTHAHTHTTALVTRVSPRTSLGAGSEFRVNSDDAAGETGVLVSERLPVLVGRRGCGELGWGSVGFFSCCCTRSARGVLSSSSVWGEAVCVFVCV
jgi:hypothetical protein